MNAELNQKLYDRWPSWFIGFTKSPNQSCLAFGTECGNGWFNLIWELCENIEKVGPPEGFEIDQIKEKFGGLRFYVNFATDDIYDLIDTAETQSYHVCEGCGSKENVTTKGSWLRSLCEECRLGEK